MGSFSNTVAEDYSLPSNVEAEEVVLSNILLSPEKEMPAVADILAADDFYKPEHKVIYSAMLEIFSDGGAINVVSVVDKIISKGKYDDGKYRIVVPAIGKSEYYIYDTPKMAEIVKNKSLLRQLVFAGTRISALGLDEGTEITSVLSEAGEIVDKISEKNSSGTEFFSMVDIVKPHIVKLEELHNNKDKKTTGIPTGFKSLDELLSGYNKSDLITIAGRPSQGKSAFAMSCVRRAAMLGYKCGVFSLEMKKEQLFERMLCGLARANLKQLRDGHLAPQKWSDIIAAAAELEKAGIYIDDTPGISITELRARAKKLSQKYGLDMLMVDYIQLVESTNASREQEIAHISRSLKKLAMELDIPILALSQMNRDIEKREKAFRTPKLSDLRESGSIEQNSDIVLFIHREDYYDGPTNEDNIVVPVKIIVEKQRNGPLGVAEIVFHKGFVDFYQPAYDN